MHHKTDPKPTEPPAQPTCNDNFVMPNLDESRVYARQVSNLEATNKT
jgi:hypothetical protein